MGIRILCDGFRCIHLDLSLGVVDSRHTNKTAADQPRGAKLYQFVVGQRKIRSRRNKTASSMAPSIHIAAILGHFSGSHLLKLGMVHTAHRNQFLFQASATLQHQRECRRFGHSIFNDVVLLDGTEQRT